MAHPSVLNALTSVNSTLNLLNDITNQNELLISAGVILERSIYLIDYFNDSQLEFSNRMPIPGRDFTFGVENSENPILYIFKQLDGTYVVLDCET